MLVLSGPGRHHGRRTATCGIAGGCARSEGFAPLLRPGRRGLLARRQAERSITCWQMSALQDSASAATASRGTANRLPFAEFQADTPCPTTRIGGRCMFAAPCHWQRDRPPPDRTAFASLPSTADGAIFRSEQPDHACPEDPAAGKEKGPCRAAALFHFSAAAVRFVPIECQNAKHTLTSS